MGYRFLADTVLVVHLLFVAFVVFGGGLALRWPKLVRLHLPAALWGAGIELTGGICPLTPLENRLRLAGGEAGYPGGFIEHYLLPLIYPAALTREVQIALGMAVLVGNGLVYWLLWQRRKSVRRAQTQSRGGRNSS